MTQQTVSVCEAYREFITAQRRLRRNFTSIYQDLFDRLGCTEGLRWREALCGQTARARAGHEPVPPPKPVALRYPRRLVDQACQRALVEGLHRYKRVKALTERLTAQALEQLDAPAQPELALT